LAAAAADVEGAAAGAADYAWPAAATLITITLLIKIIFGYSECNS